MTVSKQSSENYLELKDSKLRNELEFSKVFLPRITQQQSHNFPKKTKLDVLSIGNFICQA